MITHRPSDDACMPPRMEAPPTRMTAPTPRYEAAPPTCATPPAAAAPSHAAEPQRTHTPAASEEMALLEHVNRVRAQHVLRPLRFHTLLWVAARDHSAEQQRHGYMGHGSPDPSRRRLAQRIQQAGYVGRVFAEVVAWGYPDTASVVEGWMNSPDHRRILLDPELTEAGFSRVGEYWTGNLGTPTPYASSAPISGPPARSAPPARSVAPETPWRPEPTPAPRAQAPAPRRATPRPVPPQRTPTPAPQKAFVPAPSTGFG